jgi:hypothetical protein
MIVVARGLNILGAQIADRPAQPGFRRRTDGPYTWISFLKAFILSNPRVAATFTVLRATAQRNSSSLLKNLEIESFRILAGSCWGGAVELDVISSLVLGAP